ncbi:hypothetical protein INT48_001272 [Thamnidium elegans]|uniref:Uncharacterized protein n=1 Tax=Thamnidium elegans TaxID=101142 RepID=A0A8H7SPA3_9FUNG|nr:hypothetical protein INT48_001272 [Thamnidium elegans]
MNESQLELKMSSPYQQEQLPPTINQYEGTPEATGQMNIESIPFTIRYPQQPNGVSLGINNLLFADDVALIATKENLQHLLNVSEQHSLAFDCRWNPKKKSAILVPDNETDIEFKLYQETVSTESILIQKE